MLFKIQTNKQIAAKLFLHFWSNYFSEYPFRSEMANMGNVHSFVFRDDVDRKYKLVGFLGKGICPW